MAAEEKDPQPLLPYHGPTINFSHGTGSTLALPPKMSFRIFLLIINQHTAGVLPLRQPLFLHYSSSRGCAKPDGIPVNDRTLQGLQRLSITSSCGQGSVSSLSTIPKMKLHSKLVISSRMAARKTAAEADVMQQTNLLPRRQLLIVLSTLAISHIVCFIDQTGIGVALSTIGRELDAEDTISWAGTSALIATTIFHVLYGRMSDLFGMCRVTFDM